MGYVIVRLGDISGTNWGVNGAGIIVSNKEVFIPSEELNMEFPSILEIIPESGTKFSESGCSLQAGRYIYRF